MRLARIWATAGAIALALIAIMLIAGGLSAHQADIWLVGLLLAGPAVLFASIVYLLRPEHWDGTDRRS